MSTPKPKYIGPYDHLVRELPLPVIEVRASWNDPWQTVPGLICERLEFSLIGVGSASFRFHYGWIHDKGLWGLGPLAVQAQGSAAKALTDDQGNPLTDDDGNPLTIESTAVPTDFQDVGPLPLENWWVRVQITPESDSPAANTIWWYGRFVDDNREHYAAGRAKRAGNQMLQAVDVKYLLTRVQVDRTYVWDSDANDFFVINQPTPFNAFRGGDRSGRLFNPANKAIGEEYFTIDLNNAELWTAKDIVAYLLDRHLRNSFDAANSPVDSSKGPLFFADIPSGMDFIPLNVDVSGQTIYQIFDSLFSRQRGLAWFVYPTTPSIGMGFFVKVISLADVDVSLPTGDVIKANQSPVVVDIHDAVDMTRAVQRNHHANQYQQVVVEGGKQGAIVSLSVQDGTLEADWTVADRLEYEQAAIQEPSYATNDLSDQKTRNDTLRMGDRLRHVFTRLRMPTDWDGFGRPPFGENVFPLLDNTTPPQDIVETVPIWVQGIQAIPYLPLKARVDYENDNTNLNPADSLADNIRPFAVVPIYNRTVPTQIDGWTFADAGSASAGNDELRQGAGFDVDCSLQMHDHQAGMSLIPHGVPHVMNRTDAWDGSDPGIGTSHVEKGKTDYREAVFTVYLQAPHRVRVSWPDEPEDRVGDLRSTLFVRMGDQARVDFLVAGTVLDINADKTLKEIGFSKAIRDDRPLMLSIAKQAWLWYSRPRRAVELTYKRIVGEFQLGQLVTRLNTGSPVILVGGDGAELIASDSANIQGGDIASEYINSVVSSIAYECERGTTSVRTDYAELDFSRTAL